MLEASWSESLNLSWYILKRNPLSLLGLFIVLTLMILALLAPFIAPFDPEKPEPTMAFAPPSLVNLMGTDNYGIDIFSRVIYAARIDLSVATLGVLLAVVTGCAIGAVSGYYGGAIDQALTRSLDSMQAFPDFVLAMVIAVALGPGLLNVVLVIALVDFPVFARLIRARMLVEKESMYALAARGIGNSNLRIIVFHLLPNCLGPIYVTASLFVGGAVLLTASLSFLGLGVPAPTPEWGLMVAQGTQYLVGGIWWVSLFPGLMIWLCMSGSSLLGDGLQDIFDPKSR